MLEDNAPKKVWWLFIIQAILMGLLGILFIMYPGASIVTMIQILAFYFIFSGIFAIVEVLMGENKNAKLWGVISGIIGIVAGGYMVAYPAIATGVTTLFWIYFMAFAAIFYGVFQFITAFTGSSWSWGNFFFGLFNILFGVLLLSYPLIGAFSYMWVTGVFLIVGSIWLMVMAFKAKDAATA